MPRRDERKARDPGGVRTLARRDGYRAPLVGRPHPAYERHTDALEEGSERLQTGRRVVVARHRHHRDPRGVQSEQYIEHKAIGVRGHRALIVDVAGDQYDIDFFIGGNPDDLIERAGELVFPRTSSDRATDMPVAGMKQSHRSKLNLSKTSSPDDAATSSARVAHEGNGNLIWIGIGMCGCCRIIDPGLSMAARALVTAGMKPYSDRSASALSRRPTMRKAELAIMRRSTSLAVCSAPMRITVTCDWSQSMRCACGFSASRPQIRCPTRKRAASRRRWNAATVDSAIR